MELPFTWPVGVIRGGEDQIGVVLSAQSVLDWRVCPLARCDWMLQLGGGSWVSFRGRALCPWLSRWSLVAQWLADVRLSAACWPGSTVE